MKFNRKQLEKLTLEKIDEVNDEAGYRKYLEVPEMVEIIATIMEKKMKVFHDSDAELIQQLRDYANKLEEENEYLSDFKASAEEELEELQKIINDTLRALPVGNINTHTPDTIPERVRDWVKEAAEECRLREKWEELADKLISFAEIIRKTEGNSTRNAQYYNSACQAIEQYKKLKKEFTDGN